MSTTPHIVGNPYSNIIIVTNDDKLLATISQRKANWYIRKGLATEMVPPPEGYPRAIKLTFEANVHRTPKQFEINVNANKCVICGKEDSLTRHHVIPYVIRKHFPLSQKQYSRQWCVLLCVDCHHNVEELTQPLYKQSFPSGKKFSNSNLTLQMIKFKGHLNKLSPDKLSVLLELSDYKTVEEIPLFRKKNRTQSQRERSRHHFLEIKRWAKQFIKDHGGLRGRLSFCT